MFAPRIDKPKTPRSTARAAAPTRAAQPHLLQHQQERAALGQLLAPQLPAGAQAKLRVGALDDPLEHEADRVADAVLRMPAGPLAVGSAAPQISRKCAECEASLQRASAGAPN